MKTQFGQERFATSVRFQGGCVLLDYRPVAIARAQLLTTLPLTASQRLSLLMTKKSCGKLAISLGVAMLTLNGCYPAIGPSTYFKSELQVTVDGRAYDFVHYYRCSSLNVLSEGDMSFHRNEQVSGTGKFAADIGNGDLLTYIIVGSCRASSEVDKVEPGFVQLIETRHQPIRLVEIRNDIPMQRVKITSMVTTQILNGDYRIGPTKEELALWKSICALPANYTAMGASVTSYEEWATSQAAISYFSSLVKVTVAKKGDSQPNLGQGYSGSFIRFPYWSDRRYKKYDRQGGIIFDGYMKFDFNGSSFVPLPRDIYKTSETYYYAGHPDTAEYKGVSFSIRDSGEIYDPTTKEILAVGLWTQELHNENQCPGQV